jgi:hypothetical protein
MSETRTAEQAAADRAASQQPGAPGQPLTPQEQASAAAQAQQRTPQDGTAPADRVQRGPAPQEQAVTAAQSQQTADSAQLAEQQRLSELDAFERARQGHPGQPAEHEHPTGGQAPSLGRIVLYRGLPHNGSDVHPAMITRVLDDGRVNLTVMIDAGPPQVATDVEYWDEAEHEHEQQAEPPPPGAPAGPVVEEEVPPPETSWFWPPRV